MIEKLNPRHWRQLTADPNSKKALVYRGNVVRQARQATIPSRIHHICKFVAGKSVLDVGIVNHELSMAKRNEWLHGHIVKHAVNCLGVDILKPEIDALRDEGFNVECRDITEDPPEGQYDVIIAGELIEHLDSPGKLIAAAKRLLVPGGLLILTTPNPYELGVVWHNLRNQVLENVDHVTYLYPGGMAELAERRGMVLEAYYGVSRDRRQFSWYGAVNRWLKEALAKSVLAPESACPTLIYHIRK